MPSSLGKQPMSGFARLLARTKNLMQRMPLLGAVLTKVRRPFRRSFPGSAAYWEARYLRGGTSGAGSYGRLAEFKAEVLNAFVVQHQIESVIEFGCGDGNQLSLAAYPGYIGLDVSKSAVRLCSARFAGDPTKSFYLYDSLCFVDHQGLFLADLAISLDVIYHLIEDDVYEAYIRHLLAAARRFVIIYSSDRNDHSGAPHVRDRRFSVWVRSNCPGWSLIERIPNRFPSMRDSGITSCCEFFIFKRDES